MANAENETVHDELVEDFDEEVMDQEDDVIEEAKKHHKKEEHNPETAPEDAVDAVKDAEDAAPKAKPLPKTKAGMLTAAYDKMSKMKKEELKSFVKGILGEDVDFDDEEFVAEESEFEEDLNALVESEATLSEGFKEKASVIFEAALKQKLSEQVQKLEEQYAEELAEETARVEESLIEKVDSYLNYVVESWMEENKLAVESGIRTEIAESFMSALHGVFEDHYIEVPESKVDLVDSLAEKVEKLEEELNKNIKKNLSLKEEVKTLVREGIISEVASDLSATQAEKLRTLAEDVDFSDAESFASKVEIIKEAYFKKPAKPVVEEATIISEEDDEEFGEMLSESVSPSMERYLSAFKKSKTRITGE